MKDAPQSYLPPPPNDELPPCDIPPVAPPATVELTRFDPVILDYKIKRASTFGGLSVAGALYLVGVLVILKLMTIWPFDCSPVAEISDSFARIVECTSPMIQGNGWHGIAGVMLALFSVPTVLLIAILRMASPKREPLPDTVFTTVADKFATALERVFEPRK
ncbi:hypothetical protein ABE85_00885 [Mitsuaria sp. 7]|nr:hypothetical protein [Mitsuaria sp. 7]ANH66473.1 hypothetical protein ABE85_00885 [Mitsuaria sp. 7]